MAFIPAENGIKVELNYLQQGENTANVFYLRNANPVNAGILSDLGIIVRDWWIANMAPLTTQSTSLQTIILTDLTEEDSFQVTISSDLPEVGSAGIAPAPNNVTVVTKFTTGLTGRSNRGRSYFAGLDLGDTVSGNQMVSATFADDLGEAWEALLTALSVTDARLVIASFYSGVDGDGKPIPRAAAVMNNVIEASVNPVLDSQRRRLPGRGT